MSKCIHMNEAMLCYQCKYVDLVKENEDLKLQLLDRTEKYRIAMDKGVWELWNKNEKLTKALEVAESALTEYANGLPIYSNGHWIHSMSTEHSLKAKDALEQIKKIKKGEL